MGKESTVRAGDLNFFLGKCNENHNLGTEFFVHHGIVSTGKRVEFSSNNILYIVRRGRWCNVIVLDVHAQLGRKTMI